MRIGRRSFLLAGTAGVGVLGLPGLTGCGARAPVTPNAHLYGREWVLATYEMYGQKYAGVQKGAEARADKTYSVLGRRGVGSLDSLQSRAVPFFIRADEGGTGLAVDRRVPERLTFTANMSQDDRAAAQAAWDKNQSTVHTDYEEVRRLSGALTALMSEIHSVRVAIELGRREQLQIVRQISVLKSGEKTPFELPYQVSRKDYEEVLLLLLERLDDDCERLERIEAAMVTVGFTARTTDAGSGSLSANLYKVLLSVSQDAKMSDPRPPTFPSESALKDALLDRGRTAFDAIKKSPAYQELERQEEAKKWESIGAVLSAFDSLGVVPLKTSAIFQRVLGFYRGDGDYLGYLKTAASLLPLGGSLTKSIESALATTEEMRKITSRVAGLTPDAWLKAPERLLKAQSGKALVNAGTEYGLSRMGRQLAFFKDKRELLDVAHALSDTSVLSGDDAGAVVAKLQGLR